MGTNLVPHMSPEDFQALASQLLKIAPAIFSIYRGIQRTPPPERDRRRQIQDMISQTQAEMRETVEQISALRNECKQRNISTDTPGNIWMNAPETKHPWRLYRYRNINKRITNLCRDFNKSVDGLVEVVLCTAGIQAGLRDLIEPVEDEQGDALLSTLRDMHDGLRDQVLNIHAYSIDDLSETMTAFLEACLQVLSWLQTG